MSISKILFLFIKVLILCLVSYVLLKYFQSQVEITQKPSKEDDSDALHAKEDFSVVANKAKNVILSAKEKLELSWKFLYDITEVILNQFSKQDQEMVQNHGSTLFNAGMRYEHNVVHSVNHEMQKTHELRLHEQNKQEINQQR